MAALYESPWIRDRPRASSTAAENTALVSALDPQAHDLEGYLFPDTYTLPRKATADQLIARMVQDSRRR